jgi:choline dehydrogenase-like flavoprotein
MFIDGRSLDRQVLETELCIIGAGAAGIALAHEFLQSGLSIIVVESGGLEADRKVQDLNQGENSGLRTDLESSRLRYFGGSTNHWEGMCAPMQSIDFEARPWVSHSGWPYGLEELAPYYAEASRFLNLSGSASTDFSVPQDLLPSNGKLAFHSWRIPEQLLLAETYRSALEKISHIKVIFNTTVTNIQATADVTHVTGLSASTLDGQHFTIRAKRYILACGAIENARLLLLSNLGNRHDIVGRFFMQHPHLEVGRLFAFGASTQMDKFQQHIGTLGHPKLHKPELMFNITPSDQALRQYKILNGSLTVRNMRTPKSLPPSVALMRRIFGSGTQEVSEMGIYARCEQSPNPDSRVMLSDKKKDAFGLPVTHLHWQLTELDWRSIRQLGVLLAESVSAHKLGLFKLHPWAQRYHRWPRDLAGGSHHMGTTRMHDDPKSGVVDRNCRIHGIDNLYIAGSSVYPTAGWANPTYTLVALAIKLAKHLKSNFS